HFLKSAEDYKEDTGGLYGMKFEDIISIENLLSAWSEFIKGKRHKQDVQEFQLHLMDHIFDLYTDLKNKTYTHGSYEHFKINDPKPRDIHKATVRDRLLHHAIYRVLYPFFSKKFIADSFSCQIGKGTHRALNRFRQFAYQVSKNHTRTCWVLKCDIRKFFANIDHEILMSIISTYVQDMDILWLLNRVINSHSPGLPLGNLTSQLLVNIYMNEFDQFIKHKLKIKHYIRYADDFVFYNSDRPVLNVQLVQIRAILQNKLKLQLHPNKCFMKTIASGLDFLGWVHFMDHRVLRTGTKRRIFKKISKKNRASYEGLLKQGNTHTIKRTIQQI
ncbi:MAG: reverse transcriptase/maturase family protein, partial [Patescibacteria group bacterium]